MSLATGVAATLIEMSLAENADFLKAHETPYRHKMHRGG